MASAQAPAKPVDDGKDYVPTSILLTGGAGFMYELALTSRSILALICADVLVRYSGSNVLIHLVKAYPNVRIVCLDKLDYCASVSNFSEIATAPNFRFVKVGSVACWSRLCISTRSVLLCDRETSLRQTCCDT